MRKTFFTADSHLNHANCILYCNRPFYTNDDVFYDSEGNKRWRNREIASKRVLEMDESFIKEHNKVVGKDDTVYHLGDVCFGDIESILPRLNGNIIFLPGNHDKQALEYCYKNPYDKKFRMFGGLTNGNEKMFRVGEIFLNNYTITMCHFALQVWNKSHHGALHLYGHSHGSLPESNTSLSMDIGVDAHYNRFGTYAPFSFDEIISILSKRQFKPIDHHE